MTALQIAKKTIKDLRLRISNLHAKYGDEYEEQKQVIIMLQNEIQHMVEENERLKEKIKDLKKENAALEKKAERLSEQLETLRDQRKKTSETSDKPTSINIFKKPISTRVKSGKKPGGQIGHKGHTLLPFKDPQVIDRPPAQECECGGTVHIKGIHKKKQLVDIKVEVEVTEECVSYGYCDKCGKRHEGTFSEKYVNPVNYGDDIKAIVSLLNTRMNLPINKISELLRVLTDSEIRISDGTIVNIVNDLAKKSNPTVERIADYLINSGVLLVDETGCRVNGKLDWFQIFLNDSFTLFSHNKKRGSLLFEGKDILALFTGILLHDHFKSYYRYTHLTHAECNEHINRQLKAVNEILKHEWASELRAFFFEADKRKKELMDKGEYFSDQELKDYFTKFLEILDKGDKEYQKAIEGKQIISRFNEERCLLKRLREYASEHLRFITVPEVPRGNNGAERGAKEVKRKVRISGGFRSDKGADNYARVTSVISTMNKQKINIFQSIKDIFNGKVITFHSKPTDSS